MKKTLATVAADIITTALVTACSAPSPTPTSASGAAAAGGADLSGFDLTNPSVREVIDTLDRTNEDRANGPHGSVPPDDLILTSGGSERAMPLSADQTRHPTCLTTLQLT